MNIMTTFVVLTIGLLSTTMASVIYGVRGQNFCGGLVCPLNTACTVKSRNVDGIRVTKSTCYNLTESGSPSGEVIQEKITQEKESYDGESSDFFFDRSKLCVVTHKVVNGKVTTSKQCRDENGELRPMTPEEEEAYEKSKAEAEKGARRAAETAKRLHAEGMRRASEGLAQAHRMSAEAQEHARRVQEQAMENVKRMTANMRHMADNRARQQEALARRLEEAAARRERAQEERERRLEEAQARREMKQQEREEERERRLEEAEARREMKQQERDLKINGFLQDLPNFLDYQGW